MNVNKSLVRALRAGTLAWSAPHVGCPGDNVGREASEVGSRAERGNQVNPKGLADP